MIKCAKYDNTTRQYENGTCHMHTSGATSAVNVTLKVLDVIVGPDFKAPMNSSTMK